MARTLVNVPPKAKRGQVVDAGCAEAVPGISRLNGHWVEGFTLPPRAQRPTLPVIERQVMCVSCKIPLNVAESQQADRERAFIRALIDQGEGEGQIKRALVTQYGAAVLGLPSSHGFDLAAYLVPVAVVTGLLVLLLGRATRLLPYLDGVPKEYEDKRIQGRLWPGLLSISRLLPAGDACGVATLDHYCPVLA